MTLLFRCVVFELLFLHEALYPHSLWNLAKTIITRISYVSPNFNSLFRAVHKLYAL